MRELAQYYSNGNDKYSIKNSRRKNILTIKNKVSYLKLKIVSKIAIIAVKIFLFLRAMQTAIPH